jgi:hypothetical protein
MDAARKIAGLIMRAFYRDAALLEWMTITNPGLCLD